MEAFIQRGASDSDRGRRNCGEYVPFTLIYSSIANTLYHSIVIQEQIKATHINKSNTNKFTDNLYTCLCKIIKTLI